MSATFLLRCMLGAAGLLVALNVVSVVQAFPGFPDWFPSGTTAAQAAGPPAQPQPASAPTPASAPAQRAAATPDAPMAAVSEPNEQIAAALRARREALDERERVMALREAVLVATERRLSARVEELVALQQRLEKAEADAREREDGHWRDLAKLYETMRPREAATVFNELEMPVLAQLVDRMSDRKAAPILGAMQPERVRQLTVELARIRAGRTPA